MSDLKEDISRVSAMGDCIIVLGDFDEDVRGQEFDIWKEGLELKDVMMETVGMENSPRTHARGSSPIDTILTSANMHVQKADYPIW